jgi:aryl-alcohol dehydrogenase-like predicted oxidoreductase
MYGPADEQEAIATIQRSLALGGNFLDTADLYGPLNGYTAEIDHVFRGNVAMCSADI